MAVTALTRLLGRGFGIATAVLICLVVAGSLLGNSFVASRMCVAAARKAWIPSLFTIVGRVGVKPDAVETEVRFFDEVFEIHAVQGCDESAGGDGES